MRFPDFIIIGAAKSGTTSLFKYFTNNESFFLSTPKEPDFFARDEIYSNGNEWYSGLFSCAKEGQLCCEASTLYTLYPMFNNVACRMHKTVPEAKLVYIMRNPVKRAFSYYVQLMKNYQNCYKTTDIPKTFEEFLFDRGPLVGKKNSPNLASFDNHLSYEPKLLTSGGMYFNQINEYLKYYNRSSLHIMIFEDFISDPLTELTKLYEFLGVSTSNLALDFTEVRENISSDHFQELATLSLIEKIKKIRLVKEIKKIMPDIIKLKTRKIVKLFVMKRGFDKKFVPESMTPESNEYLVNLYMKPTVQLSEFLGRDLVSFWGLR